MKASVWPLVLMAMVFYGLGEWASKHYANQHKNVYAVVAMLGYAVNALLFLSALTRWNSLAALGTVWTLGYMIVTLSLAFMVFQEQVTPRQMVGLCLGVVAVILLSE